MIHGLDNKYLVGGLDHFLFFHILGIVIPTDFHIFQMGWNHQPDTDMNRICNQQIRPSAVQLLHLAAWYPISGESLDSVLHFAL